jgi:hypothetical protein
MRNFTAFASVDLFRETAAAQQEADGQVPLALQYHRKGGASNCAKLAV